MITVPPFIGTCPGEMNQNMMEAWPLGIFLSEQSLTNNGPWLYRVNSECNLFDLKAATHPCSAVFHMLQTQLEDRGMLRQGDLHFGLEPSLCLKNKAKTLLKINKITQAKKDNTACFLSFVDA